MIKQGDPIADRLTSLADATLTEMAATVGTYSPAECALTLIECCRVLDSWHVRLAYSANPRGLISYPDFDLMLRGWNLAVCLLLPRFEEMGGIPFGASSNVTRASAETFLHSLGGVALLRKFAEMLRHGMGSGEVLGDKLILRMSARIGLDHFLDQIDAGRMEDLSAQLPRSDGLDEMVENNLTADIDERMNCPPPR